MPSISCSLATSASDLTGVRGHIEACLPCPDCSMPGPVRQGRTFLLQSRTIPILSLLRRVQNAASGGSAYHSNVPVIRLSHSIGLRALVEAMDGRPYVHLVALRPFTHEALTAMIQGLASQLQVCAKRFPLHRRLHGVLVHTANAPSSLSANSEALDLVTLRAASGKRTVRNAPRTCITAAASHQMLEGSALHSWLCMSYCSCTKQHTPSSTRKHWNSKPSSEALDSTTFVWVCFLQGPPKQLRLTVLDPCFNQSLEWRTKASRSGRALRQTLTHAARAVRLPRFTYDYLQLTEDSLHCVLDSIQSRQPQHSGILQDTVRAMLLMQHSGDKRNLFVAHASSCRIPECFINT